MPFVKRVSIQFSTPVVEDKKLSPHAFYIHCKCPVHVEGILFFLQDFEVHEV